MSSHCFLGFSAKKVLPLRNKTADFTASTLDLPSVAANAIILAYASVILGACPQEAFLHRLASRSAIGWVF